MNLSGIKRAMQPPSNVTNRLQERKLASFLARFPEGAVILDLGAGRKKSAPIVLSVDLYRAPGVDVVGDIHALPFGEGTVDGVIARGVLEHVLRPDAVADEIFRVLKPGGLVFASIPFMQGYHPSPGDYRRYTIDGIRELFRAFTTIECGVTRGSASSYVWVAREFFAEVFSLNSMTLYRALKVAFGWLLQPVKYLDPVTEAHPQRHLAASGFTILGEKPGEALTSSSR